MTRRPEEVAREIFESLRREFPKLAMEIIESPEHTDIEMRLPAQTGLNYEVCLNLQNTDELQFNVDDFWAEWFPCTAPKIAESFHRAVSGFLAGEYRIEIYSRKGRPYKRLLQAPNLGSWETVYTPSSLHWPCLKPQIRHVQN